MPPARTANPIQRTCVYFGVTAFRPGQKELLGAVLRGRDGFGNAHAWRSGSGGTRRWGLRSFAATLWAQHAGHPAAERLDMARPAMMGDTVAIEVPAADSVDARGVVDTCVSALGPERCWLVGERDVTPRWDASIEHRDAGRLVVTLRLHGDEREAVARWELAFDAGDPPQQRWASAGVVVAALVVAESPAPAEFPAPAPASPRPEPEPPAPAAAPATQRMPSPRAVAPGGLGAAGIDAALLAGPGLTGGSARVGGLLRGFVGLRSSLMLGAELRCATGIIRGPDSAWLSAGLGPGARLGRWDAPIAVEATTQLVVEGLFVQARDALGADRAARARLGGRVAVDGVARLAAPVGVLIGGDVSLLAPPIRVEVAHATAGREPVVGWSAHAGLRVLLR